MDFIDLKTQYRILKKDIDQRIQAVLDHGQYILGPEVKELELKLAEFCGAKYALTCSSGTDALLMALLAYDIGPGDEVITTSFTFAANVEMILLVGATPVLVDIEEDTFNIDTAKLEAATTSRTKAIMPVGLYGQTADMAPLCQIARAHKIPVIEDAAQSFGAVYQGRISGNLGDIGCTSFFPAKPLGSYGDGGAVFTNDQALYDKLVSIRNHGQEGRYYHTRMGINGRLDTLQCAILLPKLNRYPQEIEMRQAVAATYTKAFAEMAPTLRTPVVRPQRKSVFAQYTLRAKMRDQLAKELAEVGIPTSQHYPRGVHEQPAYAKKSKWTDLSRSEQAAREVLSLPMYPDMQSDTQNFIIEKTLTIARKWAVK